MHPIVENTALLIAPHYKGKIKQERVQLLFYISMLCGIFDGRC